MSIHIYVEGGGSSYALRAVCRRRFSAFFAQILPKGKLPKVHPCGSRNDAFDDFKKELTKRPMPLVVLLVDSEGPVKPGRPPWVHLKEHDGWDQPTGASDDSIHLMVQCMESWLLADREALAAFYGQGFQASALPGNPNIETILKKDVYDALAAATRNTKTKGAYSKGGHSFELLALIDPNKVRLASPHANRLAETLLRLASSEVPG